MSPLRELCNRADRRPSAWIQPEGDWDPGAIKLIEIPTNDKIHDNIVVFWEPAAKPKKGGEVSLSNKMYWTARAPVPWKLAKTIATRLGRGGAPGSSEHPKGQFKFSIDFKGSPLKGLGDHDGVKPVITALKGVKIINPYAMRVVDTDRWRLVFDVKAQINMRSAGLRANLERNGVPLTETWLDQFHPKQFEARRAAH